MLIIRKLTEHEPKENSNYQFLDDQQNTYEYVRFFQENGFKTYHKIKLIITDYATPNAKPFYIDTKNLAHFAPNSEDGRIFYNPGISGECKQVFMKQMCLDIKKQIPKFYGKRVIYINVVEDVE